MPRAGRRTFGSQRARLIPRYTGTSCSDAGCSRATAISCVPKVFYNVATEIDQIADGIHRYYGDKSLHRQSHGESFLSLLEHRLRGNGLYIFDEPEAALSPSRQMYMLCRIKQLVESGSQFIVSTHSPIVMAYPGADIYEIADNGLQLTELEQTPHYLLMKRFCLDHEGMLRQLGFGIPES